VHQGDTFIKDHRDGKDHAQHGQQHGDHLENARREIEQADRESFSPERRKRQGAVPAKNAEHDGVVENGTQLVFKSPFQSSENKSEATVQNPVTFNLHIGGDAARALQTATFVVSQNGQILDGDRKPVSGLDFSKGVPGDINFVLERRSDFGKLLPGEQKTIEASQNQAIRSFIQNDLNRALALVGVPAQGDQSLARIDSSVRADKTAPAQTLKPESERAAAAEQIEKAKASDLAAQSPESRHAINRINHDLPNNQHGRMSGHQVDRHLPGYQRRHHAANEREIDRLNPEAAARHLKEDQISAQKNMLSETFAPDKNEPYHTVRKNSDHSYSVGRYGTHFNHMHRVFAHALPREVMEQLGHPPDYSKLSAILKENPELMAKIQKNVQDAIKNGEIPSAMADKFKSADSVSSLADFTNKLRGQSGEISKEDLDRNLPQSVQDGLAGQEVERGLKAGATPAETALAHQLGKDTQQLTNDDRTANKSLMDAAGKFYALGMGKERMANGDNFHWSSTADGQTIAMLAHRMASKIGTVGDCARGPRQTFDLLGFHLPRAIATTQGRMLEQSGLFREVSDPRPGDYGYRHWNAQVTRAHGGVDKGDSFIVTGVDRNGRLTGANDHHFVVPPDGGRYRGLKFLRPTEEFFKIYGNKGN
jgi:hypothetical protein